MGKKSLKSLRAIGFDVDGTLYYSPPEMSGLIGRELIAEAARRLGKKSDDIAEEYLERREKYRSNTETLKSFGLPGEEIFQKLWNTLPLGRYVKRDERLIRLVKRLGARYRLFIVSNGRDVEVIRKLKMLGLTKEDFDPFVPCYNHGWAKPEPAPFLFALQELGMKPSEVVYVGDREDVDIEGAKSVGLRTVYVGGESAVADTSVETIYDVEEVFL